MRQITTVKNQTIFDLAIQEYGNIECAFDLLQDNPQLDGFNEFPAGYEGTEFNISYPLKENILINIQDSLVNENLSVKKQLITVIS